MVCVSINYCEYQFYPVSIFTFFIPKKLVPLLFCLFTWWNHFKADCELTQF